MKIKHIGSPNPKRLAEALMSLSQKRSVTDCPPQAREEAASAARSEGARAERWRTGSPAAFAEFAYSGD